MNQVTSTDLSLYEHEDDPVSFAFNNDELDELEEYELNFSNDELYDSQELSNDELTKQLMFPFSKEEPNLSAEELQRLDAIADMIEVKRLKSMQVLTDTSEMPADHKVLSTRFVRTWREKLSDTGQPIWLRRSRLVARESAWMDSENDSLFSPASNAIVARLLPTMFLEMKENADCVMVSTDVKDEFLTLKQQALIHVDDMLVVGKRDFVMNRLVKCLKEKYEVSVQTTEKPGDEIQFLKRKMLLHHDGRLSIQTHYKHVQQMCALLGLNKRLQSKKTPGHSDMDLQDTTGELSPDLAKKFRTCAGILLCLASDLPHCQHVVRHLATYSTQPTQKRA